MWASTAKKTIGRLKLLLEDFEEQQDARNVRDVFLPQWVTFMEDFNTLEDKAVFDILADITDAFSSEKDFDASEMVQFFRDLSWKLQELVSSSDNDDSQPTTTPTELTNEVLLLRAHFLATAACVGEHAFPQDSQVSELEHEAQVLVGKYTAIAPEIDNEQEREDLMGICEDLIDSLARFLETGRKVCDDPNDIEKVEALDVLKEEIIDLITNLSCFKLPEPPKTPDSELALQPTGKRRISRDVIGLDLATMPQTRVRSYEIFPILKPPTATDSTALTKKKRPSRVRKPIQSSIVSKLDNSSVANCYTEHDRVPSPRTMPRRCSSPNPKTPIKPKKKQAPLSPCANQKILHMAPKSPSRSPQADIGKAPPMGQMKPKQGQRNELMPAKYDYKSPHKDSDGFLSPRHLPHGQPPPSHAFNTPNTSRVRRGGVPVKLAQPKFDDYDESFSDSDGDDEFLAQQREEYAKLFGLTIADMVNQKQDEEFFELLTRLADLSDKLDMAIQKRSHAVPFISDTIIRVGHDLACKMREQAQWPELTLDRFDLADDVEDIVDIYTEAARAFLKNGDQEKYNGAYDQFTVLVDDLYEDKGRELERRDMEGDSKPSKRHTIEREKRPVRGENQSHTVAFNPKSRNPKTGTLSPPLSPVLPRIELHMTTISSSPELIDNTLSEASLLSEAAISPTKPSQESSTEPSQKPTTPIDQPAAQPEKEIDIQPEKVAPKNAESRFPSEKRHPLKPTQSSPLVLSSKNLKESDSLFLRSQSERSPLSEGMTRKRTVETTVAPLSNTPPLHTGGAAVLQRPALRRRVTRELSTSKEARSDGKEVLRLERSTSVQLDPEESRRRFNTVGSNSKERALQAAKKLQQREEQIKASPVATGPVATATDNKGSSTLALSRSKGEDSHRPKEGKTISLRSRKTGNFDASPIKPELHKTLPHHPHHSKYPSFFPSEKIVPFDPTLFVQEALVFQNLLISKTSDYSTSCEFDLNTNLLLLEKQLEVLKLAKENLNCRVLRQSQQLESVGFVLSHARMQLQALGVNVV